jgi:hypothetical protein
MSSRSNISNSADGGGVGMPVDRFLLNAVEPSADGLRREGQRLLRALTQLQVRAMEVSLDFGALNVPIQKAFEFLSAHFLSNEDLANDGSLAGRLEAMLDLIDDIRRLVNLKAARLSGTPSVSPSGSGPGVLRVMEDRLSMPVPTPYSGACQPMGSTTSPNAAEAALVQFASRAAFRAPPEARRGLAKRHREGEEQEEDRAPAEEGKKRPKKWVAPPAAARRHFAHYVLHVLHNMVYRVATLNPTADKRVVYEVHYGFWKKADFVKPYRQAHPKAQDPEPYWNGKLPGGLEAFWGKAREIRQGKRTMEAENRNEAEVTAWVEQQVLGRKNPMIGTDSTTESLFCKQPIFCGTE